MQIADITTWETEELASYISGIDYEQIEGDTEIIDQKLQEKFGCDLHQFTLICQRLLPLIDVAKSPLTDERFKGFSVDGNWFLQILVH